MRTFTKNTANYMSLGSSAIGTVISGATAVSVHARIRLASISAGQNDNNILGVIINGIVGGLALSIDGTSTKLRCSARSVSTDARQALTGTTALSTGVDYSVGVVVDFTGKTITLYVNGVADGTIGSLAFANNTYTQGTPTDNDAVGGFQAPPPSTAVQFDGVIGHVAVWTSALTAGNFASLAKGTAASSVGTVAWFLPIGGAASPELATVGTPSGTITGSLPAVLALDTTSAGAYPASHPITISHVVLAGGANRVLVVGVLQGGATPPSISSVTYGGVALTQAKIQSDTANLAAIYYLVAPTAGTANIVVTLSSTGGAFSAFGVSFTGADQTSPIDASNSGSQAFGVSNNYSESITTVANVYLVDAVSQERGGGTGANSAGAGQITVMNLVDAASFTGAMGSVKNVGASGAQAMSWSSSGGTGWHSAVTSIQPVIVAGGPTRGALMLLGVG
jgi:Concanavalin A-like lectin/glucanases superfamily